MSTCAPALGGGEKGRFGPAADDDGGGKLTQLVNGAHINQRSGTYCAAAVGLPVLQCQPSSPAPPRSEVTYGLHHQSTGL